MRGPLLIAAVLLGLTAGARAQDFGAAFSGFDSGSDQPIQIEADRLEVHDEEKLAIYSGNVRVLQGGTLLETPTLKVYYRGEAKGGATSGAAVTGTQVSRIEASAGVKVTSGDQVATGDRAVFEMATDLVTLSGNVVLTQGQNVVRGQRLVVNVRTKQGHIEGGRVQTLITPSSGGARKP